LRREPKVRFRRCGWIFEVEKANAGALDNILQLFEKYGILNKVKEVDENGRQQ
jgi:aminopeptidase C